MKTFIAVVALSISAHAQIFSGSGAVSGSGSISFGGTVGTPLTLTTSSPLPGGTETAAYSQTFAATGGTGPYTCAVVSGTLPSGLGITNTPTSCLLSGTPPVGDAGTYSFNVQATDSVGALSPSTAFQLTIQSSGIPPVTINNSSPITGGTETLAYSYSFTATGGTPGYTFATCSGTLSGSGLTLSSAGVLSGIPPTGSHATYSFGVQATDSTTPTPLQSACDSFQITIVVAPTFGPPTYNGSRTDHANAWPPVSVPNLGNLTGANAIVTDPDFSNRIVRVTDTTFLTTTTHNTSWWNECGGSSTDNHWNADSTMFTVMDEGCSTYPVAFNVTGTVNTSGTAMTWVGGQQFTHVSNGDAILVNGVANTVQTKNSATSITLGTSAGTHSGVIYEDDTFQAYPIYSKAFHFPYDSFFKRGSRTILHIVNGTQIQHYDMSDWLNGPQTTQPTAVLDFDFTTAINGQHNCLPAGFVTQSTSIGGSTVSDNLLMTFSSTVGQGTSGMVYVTAYVPGKGCAMWRTDTGAITTDPGFSGGSGLSCTANGCTGTVTTSDRFTVHAAKAGMDDNWVNVTGTTCLSSSCQTLFPDAQYFWNIGTTTVALQSTGARIGGHDATGNNTFLNEPGTNHMFQYASRTFGSSSTASLVIPLSLFPTIPSTGQGITDVHVSWNNDYIDPTDSLSYFWTSLSYASGTPNSGWQAAPNVPTLTQAPTINDFDFNNRQNCMGLVDRHTGFWTNCSGSWVNINTGVSGGGFNWEVDYDKVRDQWIMGVCGNAPTCAAGASGVKFYRMAANGTSWASIPQPNTLTQAPAYQAIAITGNGTILGTGYSGPSGSCGTWYSTDGGVTTTSVSGCPANGAAPAPGSAYSLLWDPIINVALMGTEQNGMYCSTDNGVTWAPISPPDQNFAGGIRDGNAYGLTYDASGNPYMSTQGGVWKGTGGTGCSGWSWTLSIQDTGFANGRALGRDENGNLFWAHEVDNSSQTMGNPPVSNATTVFRSVDQGATFQGYASGIPTLLVGWKFHWNKFDGLEYVLIINPSGNQGIIYASTLDNNGLAPYGWQNELLATVPGSAGPPASPSNSGVTHRFAHTFTNTRNQMFQTSIASVTESQDGRYALMNTDDLGTFGAENGNEVCEYNGNYTPSNTSGYCRGDVVVVEEK